MREAYVRAFLSGTGAAEGEIFTKKVVKQKNSRSRKGEC